MTLHTPERPAFKPSRRLLLRAGIPAAVALAGGTALYGATIAAAQTGPTDAELSAELATKVKAYLGTTGTATYASVAVSRGNRRAVYNKSRVHDTASVVKMEILLMLLEKYGTVSAIPAEKKDWARLMITQSHNDSTTKLYNFLGGCDALAAAHVRYGLTSTRASSDCRWGLTTTTVTDQLKVVDNLLYTGRLTAEKADYARSLMGSVIDSQDWGVSGAANSSDTVWLKNGWDTRTSLGGLWVVHSVGVINIPNKRPVKMSIMTSKAPSQSKGVAIVEQIAKIARPVIMKAVI
ncbi:serine hydrolase [Glycomyces tritici]|uniref:Beta-lactamase n=1 Tax=Glycomyces tritici TaxID=2665176 RepID=A0ABT7YNY1_9ACTN|nr:serine hydrolase [Glycomyces tritici]MDN3240323.1 serine hydrolase [Glycomyces tritici]